MQSELIVVLEDGTIQHTRSELLDRVFGGRGRMHRVTDIRKVPDAAMYIIHWLDGPFEGKDHTRGMAMQYTVAYPSAARILGPEVVLCFDKYDDAVWHERQMLDAMRRDGIVFRRG